MKRINLKSMLSVGIVSLMMMSCQNQDIVFPDYDYSTVYFAYQHPVRTIVLGEDVYDNTLDNQFKCEIYATLGGVYTNKQKIDIDVAVDNSLTNNLFFDAAFTRPVVAMPSNYYSLASNKITLDKTMQGGVQVQLTEAFFADVNALGNTYVIPLRITNVINADSILSGIPKFETSNRGNAADWDVLPKDYVLYCLKYINPWHANYLRRGEDQINTNGTIATNVRRKQFVEDDEISNMKTLSMNSVEFPVTVVNASGINEVCKLILTFNNDNKCTVSTATSGFSATGNGSFVKGGEKKSWGNKDRDVIYLDYTISMDGKSYATKDTLVVRDRGVKMELFSPSYKVD
jgi:hypothetical protein